MLKGMTITIFLFCLMIAFLLQTNFAFTDSNIQGNQSHEKVKRMKGKYKAGELLVKFKPEISDDIKMDIHKRIGAEVLREFQAIRVQHVRLKGGLSVEEAIKLYQSELHVEYAEPVYIVETQNQNG